MVRLCTEGVYRGVPQIIGGAVLAAMLPGAGVRAKPRCEIASVLL